MPTHDLDVRSIEEALPAFEAALKDYQHTVKRIGEELLHYMQFILERGTKVEGVSTGTDWAPPSTGQTFAFPATPDLEPVEMGMGIGILKSEKKRKWIRLILTLSYGGPGRILVSYGGKEVSEITLSSYKQTTELACRRMLGYLVEHLKDPEPGSTGRTFGKISVLPNII